MEFDQIIVGKEYWLSGRTKILIIEKREGLEKKKYRRILIKFLEPSLYSKIGQYLWVKSNEIRDYKGQFDKNNHLLRFSKPDLD